jgi:hypothetical protein
VSAASALVPTLWRAGGRNKSAETSLGAADTSVRATSPSPRKILAWAAIAVASAGVLDRIAVTVGNDAITEGEVLEEIRITSFLNNEALDFSPDARRAAAERLVDQYLIRHELASGGYTAPDSSQAAKVLADFMKKHFRSRTEYEQKLKQYGISEEDLKAHLLFQLQAIQFTELRFTQAPANEADRTDPAASDKVDRQLDEWLKQVRSQTRIEFKKEAFR